MPKKTNEKVVVRIYEMHALGDTLDEIVKQLEAEFPEELVPDKSTVFRRIKKVHNETTKEQLAEDKPFVWGQHCIGPWGSSNVVLATWGWYHSIDLDQKVGPFSRRLARWVWRVGEAVGADELNYLNHPNLEDPRGYVTRFSFFLIAREYAWRETAAMVLNEEFKTEDLDLWLAMLPWVDQDRYESYNKVRDRLGRFKWVNWHHHDDTWLQSVDPSFVEYFAITPDRAPTVRDFWQTLSKEDQAHAVRWCKGTDGLLFEQQMRLNLTVAITIDGERFRPWDNQWYFPHLVDLVTSMPHELLDKLLHGGIRESIMMSAEEGANARSH